MAKDPSEKREPFESVLESVERAALEIIDEAEAEAQKRISSAEEEARRLVGERATELQNASGALLDQADAVRRRADALLEALDAAIAEVGEEAPADSPDERDAVEPTPGAAEAIAAAQSALREPAEAPSGAERINALRERLSEIGRRPPQAPPKRPDEGAVLLATQMAVSGASRNQIEARLRNDFGIDDPSAILEGLG